MLSVTQYVRICPKAVLLARNRVIAAASAVASATASTASAAAADTEPDPNPAMTAMMCGECNVEVDTREALSDEAMDINEEEEDERSSETSCEVTQSYVENCEESEEKQRKELEEQLMSSADGHVSSSRGGGKAGSGIVGLEQSGLATTIFEATLGWLPWNNEFK